MKRCCDIRLPFYKKKATEIRNIFFLGREGNALLVRYGKFGIMEIPTRSRHDLR